MKLQQRIEQLIEQHGGMRKAAQAVDIDPAYFCRLRSGEHDNPREKVLRKLGIKKIVDYELVE